MAGGMPIKLQVLQIMIVAGHKDVDAVFAEQRIPIANQHRMVSVRAIGKDRMMRNDRNKGSRPWTLQFAFEPRKLLCLLLSCQREIPSALFLTIRGRHVA